MGILNTSRKLLSTWADAKIRSLQRGEPNTKVDSGGTIDNNHFESQELDRGDLRDIKEMRESGGLVSQLVHAKALMQFGTGASFQAEEDDAAEWLHERFNDLDNLLINLGEDAIWYPYSLAEVVETQGGSFSHIEAIEPYTMLPRTNEYGSVVVWEQQISGDYGTNTQNFDPDEIGSFILSKSSARDKTGISTVLRAEKEITNYRENSKAINNAIDFAAYMRRHFKVGRDDGAVIDDDELRRVRNRVDNLKEDTTLVTGPNVEADTLDPASDFNFQEITQHDIRKLSVALGVPIELASVISEGLGSGEQSGVRKLYFELERSAQQRSLGGQFIEQIARPLLAEYSPYDSEQNLDLVFEEAKTTSELREMIEAIGEDMMVDERRDLFDRAPLDDDGVGEDYPTAATQEGDEPAGDNPLFGSGGRDFRLSAGTPDWDTHYLDLFDRVWNSDGGRNLFQFDDYEVPEFVKNRLRDAVLSGSVFSDIDSIPSDQRGQLKNFLIEELEDDRWNIDGLAGRLQDLDADISRGQAETLARTELASTVNSAREIGYEERGDDDDLFYWAGQLGSCTTEACTWLINRTNPNHGGTPVPMDELKELIDEAPSHDPEMADDLARPDDWIVHPNERKTWVRHVE